MAGFHGGDIWVITAEDQTKHDAQFYQLKPIAGFLTGEQAKQFFIQSGLPTTILGQIWCLADMDADGRMDRHEFSVAMTLIKKRLQGFEVPSALPSSLRSTAFQPLTNPPPVAPGLMAGGASLVYIPRPPTGGVAVLPPQPSAFIQSTASIPANHSAATLPNPAAAGSKWVTPSAASLPYSPAKSSTIQAGDWSIPQATRLKYKQIFNAHDRNHRGYLTGLEAKSILSQSGLIHTVLAQIWCLADIDTDGNLSPDEFCVAMHLIDLSKSGHTLPATLPPDLVPPAYRKQRRSSESQAGGVSAGHTAPGQQQHSGKVDAFGSLVSEMGFEVATSSEASNQEAEAAKQAAAVVTFEDRRKENFDKGQAELERRRQMLREQQQREEEERLNHERQEAEKRERIRQEQEQKKQQELERQMEKQRQIEQEREEQRRKAMEQRETARREMERQRQLEWERQRRETLTTERLREHAQVDRLEQEISQLKLESTAYNTKKEDVTGRIETARGVISDMMLAIESMKATYELKYRLVEQQQADHQEWNEKLTASQCERQKLERQSKMSTPFAGDADKMMQSSCAAARAAKDRLTEQLQELHDSSTSHQKNFEQLTSQLFDVRAEVERMKAECARLEESRNIMKKEWLRKKGGVATDDQSQQRINGEHTINIAWKSQGNETKKADPFDDSSWLSQAKTVNTLTVASATTTEGFGSTSAAAGAWGFESPAGVTNGPAAVGSGSNDESWFSATATGSSQQLSAVTAQQSGNTTTSTTNWASFNTNSTPEMGKNSFDAFSEQKSEGWAAFSDKDAFAASTDPKASLSFSSEVSSANIPWSSESVSAGTAPPGATRHVALYQFDARSSDELSLAAGDVVWVLADQSNAEPGWLIGRKHNHEGCFPEAYVQPQPDAAAAASTAGSTATAASSTSSTAAADNIYDTLSENSNRPVPTSSRVSALATAWNQSITSQTSNTTPPINASSDLMSVNSAAAKPNLSDSAVKGIQVVALYPWKAKRDIHLSFNKGDIISVTDQQDIWWSGSLNGAAGWFPKSYVRLASEMSNGNGRHNDSSVPPSTPTEPILAPRRSVESTSALTPTDSGSSQHAWTTPISATLASSSTDTSSQLCVAMYTYTSSEPGDLVFSQGDVIRVLREEGEWWTGSLADRTGIFPANYVKKFETSNSTKLSSGKKPEIATVIAAYQGTGIEQLTLQPGQLISVRKKSPSGWWEGELQAKGQKRRVGWFPANYVKLLGKTDSPKTTRESSPMMDGAGGSGYPAPTSQPSVEQVVATYNYEPRQDDELGFTKGSIISVISKLDADWWKGEQNGRVGMFPSNYVTSYTGADSNSSPARFS